MPFGLCNAPATFQRLMNKVFVAHIGEFICVYLDDILVFSRNLDEHWMHLRQALDRLRESKLFGRLHKCEFLKERVDYLGFEVSPEGIHASPDKVRAIIEWPKLKDIHDLWSFLGLASYYRKFIRGFSEIARSLTWLTRKGAKWEWSESQRKAFNMLKLTLATAPILKLPHFDRQFLVTTDASDAAVGAILEQDFGKGLQPVAFASRKLNGAEIRYSAYEWELLGIIWALGQWKHYFQNEHPVVIQTDHAPLRHLPNQASVNTRIWKWINIMQGYNLEIRHIPGKRNPADSLSRQDKKDALGRKSAVVDANAELVQQIRIPESASDQEIQDILKQIFNAQEGNVHSDSVDAEILKQKIQQAVQEHNVQDQNSIISSVSVQYAVTKQIQDQDSRTVQFCMYSKGKIQIEDSLKQEILDPLRDDILYSELLKEFENTGVKEIVRGNSKFRLQRDLIVQRENEQDEVLNYWRIVVPKHAGIRDKIIRECHSIPYCAHPRVQRTMRRVRKSFV